ncbi:hypothetical protein DFJ74DRAFT_662768 [Hyaloraphidium curvatum]|nr:hypothetical protein DFJ74DRAFT_662768 [Hyaloraphidium curvatum]
MAPSGASGGELRTACDACRRSRERCDARRALGAPCSLCVRRGIPCQRGPKQRPPLDSSWAAPAPAPAAGALPSAVPGAKCCGPRAGCRPSRPSSSSTASRCTSRRSWNGSSTWHSPFSRRNPWRATPGGIPWASAAGAVCGACSIACTAPNRWTATGRRSSPSRTTGAASLIPSLKRWASTAPATRRYLKPWLRMTPSTFACCGSGHTTISVWSSFSTS